MNVSQGFGAGQARADSLESSLSLVGPLILFGPVALVLVRPSWQDRGSAGFGLVGRSANGHDTASLLFWRLRSFMLRRVQTSGQRTGDGEIVLQAAAEAGHVHVAIGYGEAFEDHVGEPADWPERPGFAYSWR